LYVHKRVVVLDCYWFAYVLYFYEDNITRLITLPEASRN